MQDSGPLEITHTGDSITLVPENSMKRTMIVSLALLAAASLAAATENQNQQQTTTAKTDTAQTTTAPATTTTSAATTTADSPMVAAAKKTNRAAKKRVVITNDSLKQSTGHISTASSQYPVDIPTPEKGAEQVAIETRAKEKERAAERDKIEKKRAEEKKKKLERMAAAVEEGSLYGDVDPAAAEQQMNEATKDATKKPADQNKSNDNKHQ